MASPEKKVRPFLYYLTLNKNFPLPQLFTMAPPFPKPYLFTQNGSENVAWGREATRVMGLVEGLLTYGIYNIYNIYSIYQDYIPSSPVSCITSFWLVPKNKAFYYGTALPQALSLSHE